MKLITATIALALMATACSNKDEPVVPVPVTERTCVVEFNTNNSVTVCTCTTGAEITSCPDWSMGQEFPAEVLIPDITEAKP